MSISLQTLCSNLEGLLELKATLTQEPINEEILRKLELWGAGSFTIVVMGEIKAGKSSFINALLGHRNLVPVHSNIATSTIFKISYGPSVSYRVFFTKTSGKTPLDITADQVDKYGTESGNPLNENKVDYIQVTCPAPLLKGGLTLIDTPGLGGLYRQHKQITYQYVPFADAVFVVTDGSNAPIGKAEIELFTTLQKVTTQIAFVQTKSRILDGEAREARVVNNRAILKKYAPNTETPLFVVDSETKQDADTPTSENDRREKKLVRSGFLNVYAFIEQNIRARMNQIIGSQIRGEAITVGEQIKNILNAKSEVLKTASQEVRQQIVENLQKAQESLRDFEDRDLRTIQKTVDDSFEQMEEEIAERIKPYHPMSTYVLGLQQQINDLVTVDDVSKRVTEIQNCFEEQISEDLNLCRVIIHQCRVKIQHEMAKVIINLHQQPSTDTPCKEVVLHTKPCRDERLLPSTTIETVQLYDVARQALYGSYAGSGLFEIAGGIIGGVVASVFTFGGGTVQGVTVGGILGHYLGKFIGGKKGFDEAKKSNLKSAKQAAKNAIGQWASIGQRMISDDILPLVKKERKAMQSAFVEQVNNYRQYLKAQEADVRARGQLTSNDLALRQKEVEEWLHLFAKYYAVFGRVN